MASDWIDEGLLHTRERAERLHLALEQNQHQSTVIKDKAPDLMRGLVAEVGAAIDEYRRKAHLVSSEIEFQPLPREGFCVTKGTPPRVALECRPDYEAHVVYCNMTRTVEQEREFVEFVFRLNFTLDESDNVELCSGTRVFHRVGEAVEFLLRPVLFPAVYERL
jgi:hypothetical protein